jgi:hypothetical protein
MSGSAQREKLYQQRMNEPPQPDTRQAFFTRGLYPILPISRRFCAHENASKTKKVRSRSRARKTQAPFCCDTIIPILSVDVRNDRAYVFTEW